MNQFPMFSSGLDLASLVVSSDLLQRSWEAIRNTNPNEPSHFKVYTQPPNYTIIAFVTSPNFSYPQQEGDLVSSETLKSSFPDFLCTKNYPSFSIHKGTIDLFTSLHGHLSPHKNQFVNSTGRLIITGNSLGGSIASLFTLWLLESLNPSTTKRPLCITFGSPFIGDDGLRQTILKQSWNSSFLHVATNQDPVLPRPFILPQNPYKPFGTFLLCSESGCACFEDPNTIIDLLMAMENARIPNAGLQMDRYGHLSENLKSTVLLKGSLELGESITQPVQAGIITQLEAVGITTEQHQHQRIDRNSLIAKMQKWEKNCANQKRSTMDANRKLNNEKVKMAYLEWYKKTSKLIGYYDQYKNQLTPSDHDVTIYKKKLCVYWEKMVAEVEKNPQREGASFQIRWLYAGTNYRRMVEPLDIADYYKKQGSRDYRTRGRSQHYRLLEKWQKDEEIPNVKKRNKPVSLTEDSCFWADVEEAIISCKLLKSEKSSQEEKDSSIRKLTEFEGYVMDLIGKLAVSPEIFLKQSTFMKWWNDYQGIRGTFISYDSKFVEFMKNYRYKTYASTQSPY